MATKFQRAKPKPSTPGPKIVPKAALIPIRNAYQMFAEGQKSWTQAVAVAAGFLDLDPADILNIELETGVVTLRSTPTPISEPATDAQAS